MSIRYKFLDHEVKHPTTEELIVVEKEEWDPKQEEVQSQKAEDEGKKVEEAVKLEGQVDEKGPEASEVKAEEVALEIPA